MVHRPKLRAPAVPRRPTFLWRGLLILLPVLVLAVFGIISLRQDRLLLENEVRQRARQFASQAADAAWKQIDTFPGLNSTSSLSLPGRRAPASSGSFRVSADGRLLQPPLYSSVPLPHAVGLAQVSQHIAALWQTIEQEGATNAPATNRIRDLQALLDTKPGRDLSAAACLRLGVLLRSTRPHQASNDLWTVVHRFPNSTGETGLPLAPIAASHLLTWALASTSSPPSLVRADLDQLGSNAIAHPSILTPGILDRIRRSEQQRLGTTNLAAHWDAVWRQDNRDRAAFVAARAVLLRRPSLVAAAVPFAPSGAGSPINAWGRGPRAFWFAFSAASAGPSDPSAATPSLWLAVRSRSFTTGSFRVGYRLRDDLLALLEPMARMEAALPDYLAVEYRIAGRTFGRVRSPPPTSSATKKAIHLGLVPAAASAVLASADRPANDPTAPFTVTVRLGDPAALYARHRRRVLWLGGLVAASASVALIGLMFTGAAFRQQRRLYEMQTNFVSSVTHELRAPVGAVRLMAENFKRGKVREPGEQQRFFDYMVQECRRLSTMIENVLNLAWIEQGRQEYEFGPTDMSKLIRDTVRLMESPAADAAVRIELDPAQPADVSPEPLVDGRALQQLLINLIDNAIKHSPPNAIVSVGLGKSRDSIPSQPRSASAPGSSARSPCGLRLWVADQGPGIPPEERKNIFNRFYRRGSELRRETPGAGIGLSIVKHIAEAHGGRVWVESEVGQGSRFVVEL